ncbi:dipicolinate synthase subunit DpsA [Numidum massiliense]|uniref:dipicolinate synthase subunit DpsA n=1 Tax=Numidum massiliense TaxID=1522315 RepID=UPI0006D565EF|nr:dipicolinate synthase subunit DpsA [Numidum massiliense]
MLTGIQIAFIGGDARQLEVIKHCIEQDATVYLIGFDNLDSQYSGSRKSDLTPDVLRDIDVLVLPIVGTDDSGVVESIFTSKPILLTDELMMSLAKKCTVYTGLAKPYLYNLCKKHDIPLVEMLNRDDVAIYNSIPTVEGALMMAIQNTDITLHGANIFVLGMGRVGQTLARTLKALGGKVNVCVRRPEQYARAEEMGFTALYSGELKAHVYDADIVFNTVPAAIVTAEVIKQMPGHTLIIDLASKPGGTDFRYAERRGIKAMLAPSLPGLVAPKSAGRILAITLSQLIDEQMNEREGA